MIRTEKITMKTADGIEVQIVCEIVWHGDRLPGVYFMVHYTDKHGKRVAVRPRYFGSYRDKTGLVVFEGLDKIVLTIAKREYESFKQRCLSIYHWRKKQLGI